MDRRSRKSGFEAFVELAALMPWWAGVVAALISYLLLHKAASQPPVISVQPAKLGEMMVQGLWLAFAGVGQYLVPIVLLAGAALSTWRRHERRQLIANPTKGDAAEAIDSMSWPQFEQLVGEGFRLQGYAVAETGQGGADGGVDLVLKRGGEKFLVQCKHWRAFRVGVDVVRELYGVMAARGTAGGFVVTSGRFTDEATSFASGRNIDLIDGPRLAGLLRRAQSTHTAQAPVELKPSDAVPASNAPACPLCTNPMTRRVAKRGANAGAVFWGCSGYPACKGTRPIAIE